MPFTQHGLCGGAAFKHRTGSETLTMCVSGVCANARLPFGGAGSGRHTLPDQRPVAGGGTPAAEAAAEPPAGGVRMDAEEAAEAALAFGGAPAAPLP